MRLTTFGAISILYALAQASEAPRGVAPQDVEKYVPDANGKWACLANPEIVLDWSQVNDDYCDCPDGSDEPGTSACPNGKFWCKNEGHEGQFIPSSLVGDGLCDYDVCCDGSDEVGIINCKSLCKEMHFQAVEEKERAEKDRVIAVDKTTKIKRAAARLRSKLEEELKVSKALLGFHERELKRFAKIMEDREEKAFGTELKELKKRTDETRAKIYDSFNAMVLNEKNFNTLKQVLDRLVDTFNENLNDAAVKKTVEDFQKHLTTNKRLYANPTDFAAIQKEVFDKFNGSVQESSASFDNVVDQLKSSLEKNDKLKKRIGEMEEFLKYLSENYNPNFNDPNVKDAVSSYQEYISDKEEVTIAEEIEKFSEALNSIKEKLSEIKANTVNDNEPKTVAAPFKVKSTKSIIETLKSKAHIMINDFLGVAPPKRIKMPEPENDDEYAAVVEEFESNKADEEKRIKEIEESLSKKYGPDDIFRAMDGVKIESTVGDYEYHFGFITDIHQKDGNGQNVLIGTFDRVEPMEDEEEGLIAYFENGAKCWNGPRRRALFKIRCGPEHNVLGVSEPEKCEYHFDMVSPLGCKV